MGGWVGKTYRLLGAADEGTAIVQHDHAVVGSPIGPGHVLYSERVEAWVIGVGGWVGWWSDY